MIDISILWALLLALFALNQEPSNERTRRLIGAFIGILALFVLCR